MIPDSDLQKWQQAIKGIEAAQSSLTPEELSAFQALVELINNEKFEVKESNGYIQVIKKSLPQHLQNRLFKVHLTNFVTLCEKYFKVSVASPLSSIQSSAISPKEPQTRDFVAPPQISVTDLPKWQQAIQGIEMAQNQLEPNELSAFHTLISLMNSGNLESSESGDYMEVMKIALFQHVNNRILKVHLTNFVDICEKYMVVPEPQVPTFVAEPQVTPEDLPKCQQAIEGIEASQNEMDTSEWRSFNTLVSLLNDGNFEYNYSNDHVQVIRNAMPQHSQNLILQAHLQNFVALCEKYFNIPVVSPPPIIQPSVEVTPPPVSKPEPTEESKKSRSGLKKVIIIVGIVLAGLAGLTTGGYFLFKDSFTFAGSTDNETIDYSLIPVSSNGEKWGYINHKGEYVVNPQFDDVDFFINDLAKVTSGGRTGYINKNGGYVIAATYKSGTAFSEDLAFVVAEGGYPTCIDKNGNTKFVLNEAEAVSAFSEGLAVFITEDGKYGFVDKNGNIAINAQFERAMPFSDGLARIWQKGLAGFIDKAGKITISPQFQEVETFSEGMAAFSDGRQWGYINTQGAYLINPQFDDAFPFSQGMAVVKQGGAYGYINKKGKFVINPQFDFGYSFSDGLAIVVKDHLNYTERMLQERAGEQGSLFNTPMSAPVQPETEAGRTVVRKENKTLYINEAGKYINKAGKDIINAQFKYAGNFHNGIAPVYSAGKWGFINKEGQYVVNPQFMCIKWDISINTDFDFVQSDYYDASEFVKLFFEREAGNTFDGVNATTTLEELSNHPKYGAGLNARQSNYADYYQNIPITKDIAIGSVSFRFDNTPIYKITETYKEYDFTATPDAIVYKFFLGGKAAAKRSAVVSALKAEIEHHHGQTMKKINEAGQEVYCLYQDNGKLSFALIDDWVHPTLHIAFNQEYLSKKFWESSQSVQESPVRFVTPKPAAPEEPQVEEATPIHVKY